MGVSTFLPMPDRTRTQHTGAHLLVTNRGTAQTMLYRSDADRGRFMHLMGQLERDFDVAVLAYVLMGNHYHLVVRLGRDDISQALQFLDGNYARGFNAIHERQGALFQGRYDARPLDSEASLQAAGFYVHLNPVRAGLVNHAEDFPWSSAADHLRGRTAIPWLRLELLGDRSGREYQADMVATIHDLGSPTTGNRSDSDLYDRWIGERAANSAFERSDDAVAACLGVSVDELYVVARGRTNAARMVGIVHALRTTDAKAEVVAHRYGLRERSGVYAVARRLRAKMGRDPALQQAVSALGITV